MYDGNPGDRIDFGSSQWEFKLLGVNFLIIISSFGWFSHV